MMHKEKQAMEALTNCIALQFSNFPVASIEVQDYYAL